MFKLKLLTPGETINGATLPVSQLEQGKVALGTSEVLVIINFLLRFEFLYCRIRWDMVPKIKLRKKSCEEIEEVKKKDESNSEKDITERLNEASIGPIRMSDRKSGDKNMFGDKIQTCTVHLSKLNPDITRTVLDRQKADLDQEKETMGKVGSDPELPGPSPLSVIKGEDSESNIR